MEICLLPAYLAGEHRSVLILSARMEPPGTEQSLYLYVLTLHPYFALLNQPLCTPSSTHSPYQT